MSKVSMQAYIAYDATSTDACNYKCNRIPNRQMKHTVYHRDDNRKMNCPYVSIDHTVLMPLAVSPKSYVVARGKTLG